MLIRNGAAEVRHWRAHGGKPFVEAVCIEFLYYEAPLVLIQY